MNILSKLLGAFILILFSTASLAQDYYVCDTGDDANDGKSEATPFKTYEKGLNTFNKLYAGDSVLFCRGGVFQSSQQVRLYNSKCGAEKPCTIADYGDSEKEAPIIKAENISALLFANGGDALPDGGYVVKNLTLISNAGTSGSGISFFNEVNDVLIENVHIELFRIGIHAAGANAAGIGSNRSNDRLIVRNSTIINNHKQGWLGGCSDCLIENNHFENNGYETKIMDHNIYISSPIKSQSFRINNITFRGNTLLKSTHIGGECAGVSMVGHGIINNLTIENNYIKEEIGKVSPFCWGISIDPGNELDESFTNLKITNNKLINVGNVGISCSSCKNVTISGNQLIDEGGAMRTGIAIANRPEDTLKSTDVNIFNNKILLNHDKAEGLYINNIDIFSAYNNQVSLYTGSTDAKCFKLTGESINTDVTSNTCEAHDEISINYFDNISENELVGNDTDDSEPAEVVSDEPTEVVFELPESEEIAISDETVIEGEILDEVVQLELNPSGSLTSNNTNSPENIASTITPEDYSSDLSTQQSLKNNSNPRNGGGSGSSSGGASKSKKSSTNELVTSEEGVISYTTPNTSTERSTTVMFTETEPMDITSGLPSSEPESSKYSVKMKDVIEASRQDNDALDVTQCRAYAAGRCLMK